MSTPSSEIYICSGVGLNNNYEHSIYFENATAQQAYFGGKWVKRFTAYSYIRRSWTLRVESKYDDAVTWNYLYFRNSATGKWYYYFITNIEYTNDNVVSLALEMDVIQTYMFDYDLLPCFIERQHTETDEIGEHTIDEGLETGEYISTLTVDDADLNELAVICLSSADMTSPTFDDVYGQSVDGMFSGLNVYAASMERARTSLGYLLADMALDGKSDAVSAIFTYPRSMITLKDNASFDDDSQIVYQVVGAKTLYYNVASRSHIDGYVPKNKKVLCYPYNFLYVTNNTGGSAVYRFERFSTDSCKFTIMGAISADSGAKIFPNDYNFVSNNYDEGLTLSSFPTCAWSSDAYHIWLAQNQNSQNLSVVTAGASIVAGVAGIATGNPLLAGGGVVGAFSQIAGLMAKRADYDVQPPQAKGNYSTSVNVRNNKHTFSVYYKSVNREHAQMIDDFFTMYGYKINRIDTPNINARKAFTYVKTVGCHIKGELNTNDAVKIESIFDKGVTFWKDGDRICDYGQDNLPS